MIREIVLHFADRGYQLSPEALQLLKEAIEPYQNIAEVVVNLFPNALIVDQSIIQHAISAMISSKYKNNEVDQPDHLPLDETPEEDDNSKVFLEQMTQTQIARVPALKILSEIPTRTPSKGNDASDFLKLFQDRFHKLRAILLSHPNVSGPIPSNRLEMVRDKQVEFIGMVSRVRENTDAILRLSLEDQHSSKEIRVFAKRNQRTVIPDVIFEDSVIWVQGKLTHTQPNLQIMANEISKPGIPVYGISPLSEAASPNSYVALVSDTHVGNKGFDESCFRRFLDFLQGESGDKRQQELASKIAHVVIAGDLVDGVGVFPGQEEELEISNLNEQYERACELFGQIPSDIHLTIIPGNHDATRLALPQPPILKDFAGPLYDLPNATILGNPAVIEMNQRRILVTHGNGLERIIQRTPATFEAPIGAMIELLEHRHLYPTFGERTPIAPEWQDYLVIEEVPDIFLAGHLHVADECFYRGVRVCMGGTFQRQSAWLKRLGIHPTVGRVPVINLGDPQKVHMLYFD